MRLLVVVQRYGHEVAGGAERFARDLAVRLARTGHDVEVVTSCAVSYVDWADHYPAGTCTLDGVTVHRLPVVAPREDRLFGPLHGRVIHGRKPTPLHLQEAWMHMQGPRLKGFESWLEDRAASYDAVLFFTYLYHPTYQGLPIASALTTTVLHPTAHDEPPLYLPLYDFMFRLPHGFGFLTEEELSLVRRRFGTRQPFHLGGVGVDLDAVGDGDGFRRRFDLGTNPYVLSVGRMDPHKGATELFDYFTAFKARHPGALKLVVVGEPVRPLPPHDDVVVTGFVDEQTKHDAFAGCDLFVQASYFESFSIVLAEAWAHGKPALVQGRSDVLVGQALRSGGGLPYVGFAEFESALELLLGDSAVRDAMGSRGRSYVAARYAWSTLVPSYERFLASLIATRGPTRLATRPL